MGGAKPAIGDILVMQVLAESNNISCELLLLPGMAPVVSGSGHKHGALWHIQYLLFCPPPAKLLKICIHLQLSLLEQCVSKTVGQNPLDGSQAKF